MIARKPLSESQTKAREETSHIDLAEVEKRLIVKTGDQLLDEAIKDPTINIYLDRSPKLNTPRDYEELTKRLQTKRALFIAAEQKKKEPKIEGEE